MEREIRVCTREDTKGGGESQTQLMVLVGFGLQRDTGAKVLHGHTCQYYQPF